MRKSLINCFIICIFYNCFNKINIHKMCYENTTLIDNTIVFQDGNKIKIKTRLKNGKYECKTVQNFYATPSKQYQYRGQGYDPCYKVIYYPINVYESVLVPIYLIEYPTFVDSCQALYNNVFPNNLVQCVPYSNTYLQVQKYPLYVPAPPCLFPTIINNTYNVTNHFYHYKADRFLNNTNEKSKSTVKKKKYKFNKKKNNKKHSNNTKYLQDFRNNDLRQFKMCTPKANPFTSTILNVKPKSKKKQKR